MSTTFVLPAEEQYVSSFSVNTDTLDLRLSSDYHPGYPSSAFVVRALALQNTPEVEKFLSYVAQNETYVYCSWKDEHLLLTTEDGEEVHVIAASFEGQPSTASLHEVQKALARVSGWLELERLSNVNAQSKLNAIVTLLHEQHHRIEVKAKTHTSESAAGVLYSQHLAFIKRALNAALGTSNNEE